MLDVKFVESLLTIYSIPLRYKSFVVDVINKQLYKASSYILADTQAREIHVHEIAPHNTVIIEVTTKQ